MIKIETITNSLSNFKEKPYKLPTENKFTQKTAYQMKIDELEHIFNSTDNELEEYIQSSMNITRQPSESFEQSIKIEHNSNGNGNGNGNGNPNNEMNNTLIFTEDEILNIPEVISCLFNVGEHSNHYKDKDYYLYGIKNRESFFVAVVLLTKTDYIIKSKSEKNGAIISFKRELGLKLETCFSQFDYSKLKFKKGNMVSNLMNDYITDYSLQLATVDYIKHDICIIDIDTKSYTYLNKTKVEDNDEPTSSNQKAFYIIIHTNNNYVPIMNSNGKHTFNKESFHLIKNNFEKGTIDPKFKERTNSNKNTIVTEPTTPTEPITTTTTNTTTTTTESVSQPTIELAPLQLKAMSSYKLKDLQDIAEKRNILIKKNTPNGKMKNKTKEELYNELGC